ARARLAWRWLSFALPPDVLLAALKGDYASGAVEFLSPTLAQILRDKGYAEPHLHVGCALDFSLLWVSTLRAIAGPAIHARALQSPGGVFGEGGQLASWLVRAAIVRYLLAAFLAGNAKAGTLESFLAQAFRKVVRQAGAATHSQLLLCLSEL